MSTELSLTLRNSDPAKGYSYTVIFGLRIGTAEKIRLAAKAAGIRIRILDDPRGGRIAFHCQVRGSVAAISDWLRQVKKLPDYVNHCFCRTDLAIGVAMAASLIEPQNGQLQFSDYFVRIQANESRMVREAVEKAIGAAGYSIQARSYDSTVDRSGSNLSIFDFRVSGIDDDPSHIQGLIREELQQIITSADAIAFIGVSEHEYAPFHAKAPNLPLHIAPRTLRAA